MIALGATEISKVCLGSNELSKVCLGATELWSAAQPLPPLPMGGKRIEYIQFTGTQYIDTGFVPDSNSCVEVVCHMTTGNTFVFGSSVSYNNRAFEMYSYGSNGCQVSYGSKWNTGALYYNSSSYYKQVVDKNIATTYDMQGNVIKTTTLDAQTFTCPNTMLIGALHRGANGQTITINTKTFEIKSFIIKDNGVEVRNYIPAKIGQVGYLFDTIHEVYYGNERDTDFVLGGDID